MTETPCRLLEWDSTFFGRRIASVTVPTLTAAAARDVMAWCGEQRIDCLYFLADPGDGETARVAAAHGFEVTDVRLEFQRPLAAGQAAAAAAIREACADDLPALRSIAARAHVDTRFHFDARFPRERVCDLYRTWIERSCRDGFADAVLVSTAERGGPAGYVTLHLDAGHAGRIGLIAVDDGARGEGRGGQLVDGAVAWLAARGCTRAGVATQARNVAGVRIYERAGFRLQRVGVWYHRWFGGAAA